MTDSYTVYSNTVNRLLRGWGAGGGGVVFNLATMMVSILLNEQERKIEKPRNTKVEVMQPKIKNKSVYYLENMGGGEGREA